MMFQLLIYFTSFLLTDCSVLIPTHKQAEVFGLEPRFNVVTRNVTIISGQTAVLPCSVDFLGEYKVVWLNHRSKVLTLEDRRIITDERISIERPYVKEWNLYIRQVKPSDQGIYTCQINTDPVQVRPVWLQVQEPPQIIDYLSSADVIVQEGETVSLVCNVTGVPPPTVTWHRIPTGLREEGDIEKERIGIEGEVLVIHNVTRYCDDLYECSASNGVPPSVNKHIRVLVEFPPEIRLPNRKIGQAKGKETILECVISGYPQGVNIWRRNGEEIQNSMKYRIEIYDEGENTVTLSLRIRSIDKDDYGEYECVANNVLGSDYEFMTLHEYPLFVSTTTSTTTPTYTKVVTPSKMYPEPRPVYVPRTEVNPLPPYEVDAGRNGGRPRYNHRPGNGSSGQVFDDKNNSAQIHINIFMIGLFLTVSFLCTRS
ncbi:hypothetical protein SNE40_011304 [Patella caerulea]|uniref:Ig-like domain-containing protein n=1 Tax=Patella caerulea TaxID=87958 RepID=A0AAN8JIH5_PATCE